MNKKKEADEFDVVKGFGEYIFENHPRFIIHNEYYCRMTNTVMTTKLGMRACRSCPLMRGFTQGEQPGLPECYYYDYTGDECFSAQKEKERMDHLIGLYSVPEFPHFTNPGDKGIYASELVEKALQYADRECSHR